MSISPYWAVLCKCILFYCNLLSTNEVQEAWIMICWSNIHGDVENMWVAGLVEITQGR